MIRILSRAAFAAAGVFLALPAVADVPTAAVCKGFAKHAVRWNTEARQYGCQLPKMPNMHFDEGAIYKWCMARPNEDRSPQALGHRGILQKGCPRYQRAG